MLTMSICRAKKKVGDPNFTYTKNEHKACQAECEVTRATWLSAARRRSAAVSLTSSPPPLAALEDAVGREPA